MFPLRQQQDTSGMGGHVALCPKCGADTTHIDRVKIENAAGQIVTIEADGEDDGCYVTEVTRSRRERDGRYEGRRHTITLGMGCEICGAYSEVSLQQHKGTTFVTAT